MNQEKLPCDWGNDSFPPLEEHFIACLLQIGPPTYFPIPCSMYKGIEAEWLVTRNQFEWYERLSDWYQATYRESLGRHNHMASWEWHFARWLMRERDKHDRR